MSTQWYFALIIWPIHSPIILSQIIASYDHYFDDNMYRAEAKFEMQSVKGYNNLACTGRSVGKGGESAKRKDYIGVR